MKPPTPDEYAGFADIARISDASAWAVGYRDHGTLPLIAHLSHDTWTVVAEPSENDTSLSGVDVVSASDAWAAGGDGDGRALLMHWDGRRWTRVDVRPTGRLNAVDMLSPDDGWSVGYEYPVGDTGRTMIQRWDGASWRVVPRPTIPNIEASWLSGVAARSPTEAYAVGGVVPRHGRPEPLLLRWNGSSWDRALAPALQVSNEGELLDLTTTQSGTILAVGWQDRPSAEAYRPLVVRSDGTGWTRMGVSTTSMSSALAGVASAPDSTVIAVGHRVAEGRALTFAAHCTSLLRE